ncbi:MAG TPA: hypothetical protein VI603_02415 [Saprospiraceae bacterium]|nr:hypothetical protein [Saprospiraceae bacterium]
MKRKKNHPDRFNPDKYRDGPKKTPKLKQPRSTWDDENLDEAFDEWMDMRRWSNNGDEEE